MVLPTNVYQRVKSTTVCHFWKQGKCNKDPCRFVHGDSPPQQQHRSVVVRSNIYRRAPPTSSSSTRSVQGKCVVVQKPKTVEVATKEKPPCEGKCVVVQKPKVAAEVVTEEKPPCEIKGEVLQKPKVAAEVVTEEKLPCDGKCEVVQKSKVAAEVATEEKPPCEDWMSSGKCSRGDACPFLHSWFYGDAFSMLARLEGHCNNVSGIDLSFWWKTLFSASNDGIVHAWDCPTGKLTSTLDVGEKIGCLINGGDWLFLGLSNSVKAINTRSRAEYNLSGPTGEVYALEIGLGVLYAATRDGMIVAWRVDLSVEQHVSPFQPPIFLNGHKSAVICLKFGVGRLFSGSMDGTIITWDNKTLECIETTKGHDDAVMSLLCYDSFLLSCSLDQKIKVWALNEERILEVVYTHEDEDCGALGLCGVENPNGNAILLCSWNNDTVSVYELPSFKKRGKMYSKGEVRTMRRVNDILFTGDATGIVTVWRLAQPSAKAVVESS